MKIKSIIAIAAATLAVGAITSQAQVYSQNIVGYVNVTVPAGQFVLIQNPLTTGNDVLTNVIPLGNVPKNTEVFLFSGGSYTPNSPYSMTKTGWSPAAGTVPVAPGQGFFMENVGATNFTLTLTGSVVSSNAGPVVLSPGFNLVGSAVPVAGLLKTQLGLIPVKNDYVYQFNDGSGTYLPQASATKTGWSPSEPNIGTNSNVGVAEGFFYFGSTAATINWTNAAAPY